MSDRSSGISKEEIQEEIQEEIKRWNALTPKQQADEQKFFDRLAIDFLKRNYMKICANGVNNE